MDFKTLHYEVSQEGIAWVRLNRPDVLNAVNMEMRHDFTALVEELFFNEAVKVVIFTGAGRGFSAGGDMAHFEQEWLTPAFRANSRRLARSKPWAPHSSRNSLCGSSHGSFMSFRFLSHW